MHAMGYDSPPLEYSWPYPVFEEVRYDEMQRDTAQIQLDIARYARI